MLGKWYKITGITDELLEAWKSELRDDLIVYRDEYEQAQIRIRLTWLEALKMRFDMLLNNMRQPYCLQLVKEK